MINIAIILFALAALMGLTVLIHWLSKKEAPKLVIYTHGTAAAIALVSLVIYAFMHPENFPKLSLVLFALAAVAGFYMFFLNQVRNTRPVAFGFIHALVAVSGFVLLLIFAFA